MKVLVNPQFAELSAGAELTISQSGFVTTDETWHQPPLPAPSSRLYFVESGSGMLVSDECTMPLEGGYVYLAPTGIPCGFYGTDALTKLYFHINVILPDGYDLFARAQRFGRLPCPPERIAELKSLYFGEDAVGQILLKAALWETAAQFARELLPDAPRRMRYSDRVTQAIAFVRSHLSATLTVREVAGAVFCSETALSAAFRKEVGATVAAYVEDLVFFEARRRLLAGDETIGQISTALGFSDQFYFSRRFRMRYGMSPRAYRAANGET